MDEQEQDLISNLPDDIIGSIFSHLKLKEAARTSVLSRRWINIWTYTTRIFDFVKSQPEFRFIKNDEDLKSFEAEQRDFIEWVNLVLQKHKCRTFDELSVRYHLDKGCSDMINSWIKLALERHVKKLDLNLGIIDTIGATRGTYSLTTQVLSYCSLGSLAELRLRHVKVDGEALEYLLSSSPMLEVLNVEESSSLVDLKIGGPLPRLRCLKILRCLNLHSLEVHAINIVSFTYHGPEIRLFFSKIPRLVEAKLGCGVFWCKYICQCHSSSHFSRLESLIWDMRFWTPISLKSVGGFPELPKFEKLNQLKVKLYGSSVKDCVHYCTKLFKASPSLHRFVLKIYGIMGSSSTLYNSTREMKRSKYEHKQLKVMEFIAINGIFDKQLAVHLFNMLPSLEKVIIEPKPVHVRSKQWRTRLHKLNAQEMQRWLPPGVQLVVPLHEITTEEKGKNIYFKRRRSL